MATLSTTDKAALQSAIDLMVRGTAYETPLADDVIVRLAPLADSPTFAPWGYTKGRVYEVFRDNPVTSLILFAVTCGEAAGTVTEAQASRMREASKLMTLTTAYERPFDATVAEVLSSVAEETGFLTKGGFMEAIRDRPVSTMLQWALLLGS